MLRHARPLLILLLILGSSLAIGAGSGSAEQAADPSVDCDDGGRSQLEMSVCADLEADAAQRKLDALLRELEGILQPSSLSELRNIQADWAKVRERDCRWEHSLFSGGSIAPLVYARCVEARTLERISRLKLLLCEGAGMTGPCEASERY